TAPPRPRHLQFAKQRQHHAYLGRGDTLGSGLHGIYRDRRGRGTQAMERGIYRARVVDRRISPAEKEQLGAAIFELVEQEAASRRPIATGATRLLVIRFERPRH